RPPFEERHRPSGHPGDPVRLGVVQGDVGSGVGQGDAERQPDVTAAPDDGDGVGHGFLVRSRRGFRRPIIRCPTPLSIGSSWLHLDPTRPRSLPETRDTPPRTCRPNRSAAGACGLLTRPATGRIYTYTPV